MSVVGRTRLQADVPEDLMAHLVGHLLILGTERIDRRWDDGHAVGGDVRGSERRPRNDHVMGALDVWLEECPCPRC